jgi:D-arabinose 1-dehydrogenase-like Zn-dependent alcohol dehydrogenase
MIIDSRGPRSAASAPGRGAFAPGVRVGLSPAAEAYAFLGADMPLQRIAVTEVTLRDGELLVEIELALVCGVDRRAAMGTHPRMIGHEQVGRIVALGPGSAPSTIDRVPLAVGDRIVWGAEAACGECPACVIDRADGCQRPRRYGHEPVRRGWELSGGLATHTHLLAHTPIAKARDWVPATVVAPAACATAAAAAAFAEAERTPTALRQHLYVRGCGLRGLTAIAMGRERGARITAVDGNAERRSDALAFGADAAVTPEELDVADGLVLDFRRGRAEITRGRDGAAQLVGDARPPHLLEAVRFLERADHALFDRLVGETLSFDDVQRALVDAPQRGVRFAVRP